MSEKAYHLGLIGWPLEHSRSPILHQAALESLGMKGNYRCFPVEPLPAGEAHLRILLDQMRQKELHGLNVTVPHKETVINSLDRLTAAAERIGAVNTLFMDGHDLVGDNTDRDGFLADLDATLAPSIGHALVMGAGGAARAVVDGLTGRGWKVWVAARRTSQAHQLAESLNQAGKPAILPIKLDLRALQDIVGEVELIVNATPLGMTPDVHSSPWPKGMPFPPQAVLYDIVYAPQETRLIKEARKTGLRAMAGLGMLVEQAALSFERWTGQPAAREAMCRAVEGGGSVRGR